MTSSWAYLLTPVAAEANAVYLVSIYKPLLMLVVLGGWAWTVTFFDKDMEVYYLPRELWNMAQIAAAAAGFGLWLLIPYFWFGLLVALLLTGGTIAGYVFFRNNHVTESARWTFSIDSIVQKFEQIQTAQVQSQATVHLLRKDGSKLEVPSGQSPYVAAHLKLEELLDYALPRKASRIDLFVGADQKVKTVVQIDGAPFDQPPMDAKTAISLIDYLKENAGLDLADRRRLQNGQILVLNNPLGKHTLAIASSGSSREANLSIRIDPQAGTLIALDKLGLLDSQKQTLDAILKSPTGVCLVASPPQQGQTTTLYSLLYKHDPYTQSIVTLEDQVAYEIEGVSHKTIEPGADPQTLAQTVATILRQDPQVFMLAKLTDPAIAKQLAQAGKEVRIYAGVHQDDTFSALKHWVTLTENPKLAADSLTAIIAQRLVRKLCPACRVPYKPDPDALKKLNLPPDRIVQFFKHSGQVMEKNRPITCSECLGLAYRGRIGVYEILVIDDQARALIAQGQADQLRAHLRKQKMLWLQEAALAKVVNGATSIGEITRVLVGK